MAAVNRVFTVDGKPFFPLGGQSCNSSGYNDTESETAFKVIKMLHGNTLEIPVYWDNIEPKEGTFDFTAVDALISRARRHGIKLILLWFATWKNGNMDYAPSWVKTDPQRFQRVITITGSDIWNLSSHCKANLEADKKAFTALCKHLKTKDGNDRTVIALQVENEPGIIGSDRDYSPAAQTVYDSKVSAKLIAAMKAAGKGKIYDIWQESGGKKSGTWPELFGWEAGELMTAWSIAGYIDAVAAAGKAIYDIPMYINVWMMEQPWWPIPGESYPSGGAVSKVLDIYKWFTPHIDIIAPDNYADDSAGYKANSIAYSRDDNPYFTPETAGDQNMFRGIADYNLIGNFFFGIEYIVNPEGSIRPEYQSLVDNFHCVASAIPLLLKYQGTGKIHAVIQEYKLLTQRLDLDGYMGIVDFGEKNARWGGKDWRHNSGWMWNEQPQMNRGRGLVVQASRNEFYLAGVNCRLFLRHKPTLDNMKIPLLVSDWATKIFGYIVSVDEGNFDNNGEFVADRRRNGDEIFRRGLWVEPDIGVLHVITCD
ncbi:MAG: DUF5597 domain-containing protein [Dehalococcoidales bacterium]|jgi:hypothetical protein